MHYSKTERGEKGEECIYALTPDKKKLKSKPKRKNILYVQDIAILDAHCVKNLWNLFYK